MGLTSYFKPKKATAPTLEAPAAVEKIDLPPYGSTVASTVVSTRRNSYSDPFSALRHDALANYLHQQQQERMWIAAVESTADQGAIVKKSRDEYACYPDYLSQIPNGFFHAITMLNVRVRHPPLKHMAESFITNKMAVCNYHRQPVHQSHAEKHSIRLHSPHQ